MRAPEKDTIMEFPCRFPIKVVGLADQEFGLLITGIIGKHVPGLPESSVKSRLSRQGNYMSVTVTIDAQSRQQLDNIYLELTAHEKVLMAL